MISGFDALAPVVRKAACGDLNFCDLSPPVSLDWSLAHGYTF